ncbi:MAG: UvrD-helicase domain-containing protein [Treponemataceae bacterium]|nr:UvrD-helicase domain-containing protein [Treponemataceae bacterium]
MKDFSLNKEQQDAVTTTEGFVRIIAGAGSGKTQVLSQRFAYLVNEIGVPPGNILCVTFTNKAAAEMKQRIRKLTGDNDTGYISTFHSFCVTVLQEDSHAVQYPKSFFVLDNHDIDDMLQRVYDERGLTLRDMTFSNARDMIEIIKLFEKPDYYNDMIGMSLETLQEKYMSAQKTKDIIFYGYLYQEKKCFALDYNDLLKFTLYIFSQNEEIRHKWQERLEYIMIDEFQDIDTIQYELMQALCDYHKNLFVVGDPDQTIYTWRGADIRFLLDFDKVFPETKTILMNTNYRSTPEILSVANALISVNKMRMEKALVPTLPSGVRVHWHHAKTTQEEGEWIAERITSLVEQGAEYRDITILYRAHYISRTIEEVLADKKVPFTMYSGLQFFDREEIKDALSYLRMLSSQDDFSFRRIVNKPHRNIGKTRIKALEDYAGENDCTLYQALQALVESETFAGTGAAAFIALITKFKELSKEESCSKLLGRIIDESGYERLLRTEGSQTRLDNLAELKQSVHEFEINCGEDCSVEYYLAHAALMSSMDTASVQNAVKLMTVHTAKGLEFPHVILCGFNEFIFPSRKIQTKEEMEEERRLAFVAFTRAKESLTLTDAEGQNIDGSFRFPSRFLFDLMKAGGKLEISNAPEESLRKSALTFIDASIKSMEEIEAVASIKVGQRVRHKIQGDGTIVEKDDKKKMFLIQFDTLSTTRRISYKAKLEVLE